MATPVNMPIKGQAIEGRGLGLRITEIDLNNKKDLVLFLYRHPASRDKVIDFFVKLTGAEEVALVTLYYSDKFQIDPILSFSLVYHESRFVPLAVNNNPSSVDRGLFQLNNRSFPSLENDDFFNIDVNARHGVQHLNWCLKQAKNDQDTALAIYNAGLGRVSTGSIPVSTQAYIRNIHRYQNSLFKQFKTYITDYFSQGATSESDKEE